MWFLIGLFLVGCATKPITPDPGYVKVSREAASPRCREIGPVRGATLNVHGTAKDALEDLKKEASLKGANFVVVQQYSSSQTVVTGLSYDCP